MTWPNDEEEFYCAYTVMGRLARAGFALTPQAGESGYDTYDPDTMAVDTTYYDPGGRVLDKMNEWWVFDPVTGTYPAAQRVPIVRTTAVYGDYLGLKTETGFWSNSGGAWSLDRTEYYTNHAATDYLTAVDYNDGLANEVTTWSYDATGNRVSDSSNPGTWTYDGLNRMTASPGLTYTHDLVGNRLSKSIGIAQYGWDELSRMVSFSPAPNDNSVYAYRADGLRVSSGRAGLSGTTSASYYYDGQMGVEDLSVFTPMPGSPTSTLTRYSAGLRGIDMISKSVDGGAESKAFPLYDVHGSMLATLARSGSSYNVGNVQSYDVWGGVRSGSSTEDQGYVANVGHRKDGESGLLYMRARYYEPASGRFISEDPAMHGINYYIYCANNPIQSVDPTGKYPEWVRYMVGFGLLGAMLVGLYLASRISTLAAIVAIAGLLFLTAFYISDRIYVVNTEREHYGVIGAAFLALFLALEYTVHMLPQPKMGNAHAISAINATITAYFLIIGILLLMEINLV